MVNGGTGGRVGAAAGILVVLAAMALAAFVRLRLAEVPLERDEGEYACAGRLILEGVPPYRLAYNMKFPGTYYACALIMAVFGETTRAIRIGLLLVNAATALLVLAIGRRLLGALGGTAAAACFAVFSLDLWIMGPFAHATHFVLLPVLAAVLLLLGGEGPPRPARLLLAGALLGLGVLVKQHAAAFLLPGAVLALRGGRRGSAPRIGLLAAGAALPVAALVAILAAQGLLDRFWFWTVRYAAAYATLVPLRDAPGELARNAALVMTATLPFWCTAAAGLVLTLVLPPARPGARLVPAVLALSSALAVCPGFNFREHYFILLLPAAALLAGAAAAALTRGARRLVPARFAPLPAAAGLLALLGAFLAGERGSLFFRSPREVSRLRYGANPFVEMEEIGRVLRDRTGAGDRIVVFGSEPEVFFHAGRRPATGYLYMYPLTEDHPLADRMRGEFRAEVEAARPEIAIFVSIPYSWGLGPDSDPGILEWAKSLLRRDYRVIGVAEIVSPTETRYAWDVEARRYRPRSSRLVQVWRRREMDD